MIRTPWTTALILTTVLAAGTAAVAQGPNGRGPDNGGRPGPDGPGRDGRGGFGIVTRDLDLSDAQRQQIKAIVTKARADSRPLAERVRAASDAHRKAMTTLPVDESQIRVTMQALNTVQTDLAIARAHVRSDIFAVLTPDQQAKATAARERRQARGNPRRSRN
jgi:Spy/CpxP family protein refolding chaperone